MKRYAMKADAMQAPIVAYLRSIGCKVDIIGRPVDLLIRIGSRYVTAEVKTLGPNQKRRMQAQIDHAKDAAEHDAPHYVLMSLDEAGTMYRDVMNSG